MLDAQLAPVLHPNRDRLPTACSRCGSRMVQAEPPLGRSCFGSVTCIVCGSVLAYVRHLVRPVSTALDVGRSTSDVEHSSNVQAPTPNASLPGCDAWCRPYAHDPLAHEHYGRTMSLARTVAGTVSVTGVYAYDGVVVDFDELTLTVLGRVRPNTVYDWRVLRYLAARCGRFVDRDELSVTVWHGGIRPGPRRLGWKEMHALNVHLSRLRAKLKPAEPIESGIGTGAIRLRAEGATRLPHVLSGVPHCSSCSCSDSTRKEQA